MKGDALCVDFDHFGIEAFGGVWIFVVACCCDGK